MEHDLVLASGLPKARKTLRVDGIAWNNGVATNVPIRLTIGTDGRIKSFYPSSIEKIPLGSPVQINASYITS